jgi:type IV pilus assembly protein PilV
VDKNTGFTLIEVLIAMLVLAGGLLGLAGLQAASLSNGQSAYNRSQATQLAYQLADNMRPISQESPLIRALLRK